MYLYEMFIGGMYYVGKTVQKNVRDRWSEHQRMANAGTHFNYLVQDLFNKGHKMQFRVIDENPSVPLEHLESKRIAQYIEKHGPYCINLAKTSKRRRRAALTLDETDTTARVTVRGMLDFAPLVSRFVAAVCVIDYPTLSDCEQEYVEFKKYVDKLSLYLAFRRWETSDRMEGIRTRAEYKSQRDKPLPTPNQFFRTVYKLYPHIERKSCYWSPWDAKARVEVLLWGIGLKHPKVMMPNIEDVLEYVVR